mmetsp:Transcript_3381/g.7423  ORF Transcript_3381/g.7423 Transcript_3381/m.7423 type:complete len:108 (+) Transcript_3381:400-723(+)
MLPLCSMYITHHCITNSSLLCYDFTPFNSAAFCLCCPMTNANATRSSKVGTAFMTASCYRLFSMSVAESTHPGWIAAAFVAAQFTRIAFATRKRVPWINLGGMSTTA